MVKFTLYLFPIIFTCFLSILIFSSNNVYGEFFNNAMDTIKLKTSSGDKYSIDVDYKQVLKHKNKVIKNSGADADRLIFSNGEKIKLFYDKNYDFDKVVIYLLDGSFKIVNDKNNGGEKIKLLGEKFKLYQDDVYYQKNLKFKFLII